MQRGILLFVLFFLLFYSFSREEEAASDPLKGSVLQRYKNALLQNRDDLALSQYYLGYGNLTGLELSYQDNIEGANALLWPLHHYSKANPWSENQKYSIVPDSVSGRVKQFLGTNAAEDSGKAHHLNISGNLYGLFQVQSDKPKPFSFRLPQYLYEYYHYFRQEQYDEEKERYEQDPENNPRPEIIAEEDQKVGNITTYSEGPIELRLDTLENTYPDLDVELHGLRSYEDASLVVINLLLKNYTESDSNSFDMLGVYFQDTGSLVATTRSAKFRGNYALPHFTMGESNFNKSKTLMSRLVNATNIQNDVTLEDIKRSILLSQQLCELVAYFQFERTGFTKEELRYIDDELQRPQGVPMPKSLPELEISHSMIYSPDCGLVFETTPDKLLSGKKLEVTLKQIYNFFVLLIVVEFLNLNLFRRQTHFNRTPSQLANISKITVFILSLYDAILCLMSVLYLWTSRISLVCTCLGLLSGILFIGLEVRYMTSVTYSQANERGTTLREILRGSQSENVEPSADDNGAAAPATVAVTETLTNNAAAATPESNTVNFDEASVLIRFIMSGFMISLVFLNLMLSATLWRVNVRRSMEYVGFLLINSYWVPQFFRNTLKNQKQAFKWEFVLGSSMVRLVPIIYLCLDKSNPFRHSYNPRLAVTVVLWLMFQILMLYLQSVLGARFWVSSRWLPEQYNYHPVMNITDLEHGFASDILASMKPHSDETGAAMCDLDCPICMSTVTIPVLTAESAKNSKLLESMMSKAMVTPCHHIFHTQCLKDWMVHKLQCPVCRCPLPPA